MLGKVCIITTVHQPFDNRIFHKEAKTLANAGYEVTLIAQHDKNEVVDGINIVALPKIKNRLYRILLLGWKAFKLTLNQNADIYHFHDPEFLPWANKLKNKTKSKVIYDVHEDYVSSIRQKEYIPPLFRPILSIITDYLEKYYSKGLVKIIAEKYYLERFPDGNTILNYPILFDKTKEENEFELNIVKGKALIYTGNVSIDRGALIYPEIVKLVPNTHMYIVGKCNHRIVELMYEKSEHGKDRLHIDGNGFIPFEKILSYYNNNEWLAGLAIFPFSQHYYQKELTKFFEYMKFGIPIIASNFPLWKKLIEGNNCGICVDPYDLKEIKEAINYLINNPDKRKIMGVNGNRAVRTKYNWEIEIKKLVNLYKKIL